jgi:hypothetical protein
MFAVFMNTATGKVKAKIKLSLCLTKHHATKTYWESGDVTPLTLNVGTSPGKCSSSYETRVIVIVQT